MLRYPLALFLFAGCGDPELARNEQPNEAPNTDIEHAKKMAAIQAMREEIRLLREQMAESRKDSTKKTSSPPVEPKAPSKKPAQKAAAPSVEPKTTTKGGIVIKTGADDPLDGL